jgi:hypothetical protein
LRQALDQARGVEPAALGLQVRVELIDQRGDGQPGAVAPGLVEHQAEVLAHPVDREAEVELVGHHGLAAVVELPALRRALADDVQHQRHVQPRALTEGDGLGQALHQAGDGDLVDHLGQLPGTALADAGHGLGEVHRHRLHRVKGRGIAAAHHGQRTVHRAGLAAGNRGVDEVQALGARLGRQLRATRAGCLSSSTMASLPRPAKAIGTSHAAQIIVIANARKDHLGIGGRLARCARRPAAKFLYPLVGLLGGAVVDSDVMARAGQVPGHRIAHDSESEEGDVVLGYGIVGLGRHWLGIRRCVERLILLIDRTFDL